MPEIPRPCVEPLTTGPWWESGRSDGFSKRRKVVVIKVSGGGMGHGVVGAGGYSQGGFRSGGAGESREVVAMAQVRIVVVVLVGMVVLVGIQGARLVEMDHRSV